MVISAFVYLLACLAGITIVFFLSLNEPSKRLGAFILIVLVVAPPWIGGWLEKMTVKDVVGAFVLVYLTSILIVFFVTLKARKNFLSAFLAVVAMAVLPWLGLVLETIGKVVQDWKEVIPLVILVAMGLAIAKQPKKGKEEKEE